MTYITKKNKKLLLELRRDKVQQLVSRGYSQRDIAKDIGCSPALINSDIKYLRARARENLEHYINVALPEELDNSLIRLRDCIKHAFEDIENPTINSRDKHAAIQLVKDCTALRLEIISGGILTNQINKHQSSANISTTQAQSGTINRPNQSQ